MKLVVVALGGNALIREKGKRSPEEQKKNLLDPAKRLAAIVKRGHKLIITHGNGPQVGDIWDAERKKPNPKPLHECVEQTQRDIGSHIGYAFRKAMPDIKLETIITHVRVDKNDIAFSKPTKGVGKFFQPPIDMNVLSKLEKSGSAIKYVPERGYREVVASPEPEEVLELDNIRKALFEEDVVVACGGGGIPLFKDGSPARAVVDKDLATERLATAIGADCLAILTKAGGVALDYDRRRAEQDYLSRLNLKDAKKLVGSGYFETGTILPKVRAAVRFAEETGNDAQIGSIDGDLGAIFLGKEGTTIGKGKTVLASGKVPTI